MSRVARRVELAILQVYRAWSATKPRCCRFTPSCSEYAREALSEHGFFHAHSLLFRRILRCRPGGGFGYDPVPAAVIRRHPVIEQGSATS